MSHWTISNRTMLYRESFQCDMPWQLFCSSWPLFLFPSNKKESTFASGNSDSNGYHTSRLRYNFSILILFWPESGCTLAVYCTGIFVNLCDFENMKVSLGKFDTSWLHTSCCHIYTQGSLTCFWFWTGKNNDNKYIQNSAKACFHNSKYTGRPKKCSCLIKHNKKEIFKIE